MIVCKNRNCFGIVLVVVIAISAAISTATASAQATKMTSVMVYKSPTCGCCSKWAEHLRANGFAVKTEDVADMAGIRLKYGVSSRISSCHTAIVDGYVIEGHVPADVIRRLLKERSRVAGIAVPGMPIGSPGMEGPNSQPYDVLAFDRQGYTRVYASR